MCKRELDTPERITDITALELGDIVTAGGVAANLNEVVETIPAEDSDSLFREPAKVVIEDMETGEKTEMKSYTVEGMWVDAA